MLSPGPTYLPLHLPRSNEGRLVVTPNGCGSSLILPLASIVSSPYSDESPRIGRKMTRSCSSLVIDFGVSRIAGTAAHLWGPYLLIT